MTNFVTDGTALPYPKVDRRARPPGETEDKFISAANWNTACDAIDDIRTWIQNEWPAAVAVNVKTYGATGDGTTDDRAAIQRALDSATNMDLYFPPGTYMVSAPLTKTSGRLRIRGGGSTVKAKSTFSSTGSYIGIIDARGLDELQVFDLTIDGNRTGIGNGTFTTWLNFIHAIYAYQCGDVYLHNCIVQHGSSVGLFARQCTGRVTIRRNRISDTIFHPICVEECNDASIVENRIVGYGNQGTDTLTGGIGIEIIDCLYVDCSGNHVSNTSDTGIKGQGCSYAVCIGNTVEDAGKDGIKWCGWAGSVAQNPSYVRVANNTVQRLNAWRSDGSSLILIGDMDAAYVGGNQVQSGGTRVADGIRIVLVAGAATVSQKLIVEGNTGVGIDGQGMTVTTVSGMTIRGNRFDGPIVANAISGDCVIEGNVVNNAGTLTNSVSGISVFGIATSGSVEIRNNIVADFAVGIYAQPAASAVVETISITQNVTKNCYQGGIRVDHFSTAATIRVLEISSNVLRDTCAGGNSTSAIKVGTTAITIPIARITGNTIQNLTGNTIDYWLEMTGVAGNKVAILDVTGLIWVGVTNGWFVSGYTEASRLLGWRNSAAPTVGTWERGDVVLKSNPSASGETGYVCVSSGTPGTWKNINGIAA